MWYKDRSLCHPCLKRILEKKKRRVKTIKEFLKELTHKGMMEQKNNKWMNKEINQRINEETNETQKHTNVIRINEQQKDRQQINKQSMGWDINK